MTFEHKESESGGRDQLPLPIIIIIIQNYYQNHFLDNYFKKITKPLFLLIALKMT